LSTKQLKLISQGETLKDPDLDTAEERAKMMEALYKERSQFIFEGIAKNKKLLSQSQ